MNMLTRVMTRSRWEGLAIVLVAGGYLLELKNIPSFYEIPGVPGPMAFPRLLGIVFGLAGLWLLFSKGEGKGQEEPEPVAAAANGQEGGGPGEPRPSFWHRVGKELRFYAMWAAILGYFVLWPLLGFPIATFLLLVIFFYLMEETRWPVVIGLSLVSTISIYVVFAGGLRVKLGLGLLEPLFR
jgi:hypothetical protein